MNSQPHFRLAAVFLLIEGLLIFVPLGILGAAINWPASLDEPASVNLPLILEQAAAVTTGYTIYLVYSILFLPVALLLIGTLNQGENSPLLRIASGFAVASMLARTLGIIRWLLPMPLLAQAYTDPAASAETQMSISLIYDMLNSFAGSVGELLGVSLFASIWLLLTSVVIVRSGALPRWLGVLGIITALVVAVPALEIFGYDMGLFITISGMILHLWFLLTAIILFFKRDTQPVSKAAARLA